jgi:hypothetical protein
MDQCDPAQITGRSADEARQLCSDALVGQGAATVYLRGPTLTGKVVLFNGTPRSGFPTILFHSDAGTPVTLVSEMQNSPLPGFGTLSHTLVAQSAGGAVPDGIPIVDTSFTISKQFTDQQLARKAKKTKKKAKEASGSKARRLNKKARKLKQRSKKSYVQGRCTDGELITRNIVRYVDQSTQSDSVAQECT